MGLTARASDAKEGRVEPKPPRRVLRSRLGRHLEGWQAGAVAVAVALAGALLMAPRPVEPELLPAPAVDGVRLAALDAAERRLAAQVTAPLPFATRLAGEGLRELGLAAGDAAQLTARTRGFQQRVRYARQADGDESVRRLRALQTQLFERAVLAWPEVGAPPAELAELGGDFGPLALASGWVGPAGTLQISVTELRLIFRVRWTHWAGLSDDADFAPTLDEVRAYYGLLLRAPEGGLDEAPPSVAGLQLAYVQQLARRDPSYPAALARGILLYRRGDAAGALVQLGEHLGEHPQGPWSLRARNYWRAARARLED